MARRQEALAATPWLHAEVARRMAERLAWIRAQPKRVLDWSAPPAIAPAAALTQAYPNARVVRVGQPSPRRGLARWLARDPALMSAQAVPAAAFDLVWSVLALPGVPHTEAQVRAWARALAPGGFLMVATLGATSLALLRTVYEQAGWGPPHAALLDMHDLGDMLVAGGLEGPVVDQETLTLTYASPQALLAELRQLGHNLAPDRCAGLRTPRWREHLHRALAAHRNAEGRLALTLEVVYGHAFKGAGVPVGREGAGVTAIDVDEMRALLRQRDGRR